MKEKWGFEYLFNSSFVMAEQCKSIPLVSQIHPCRPPHSIPPILATRHLTALLLRVWRQIPHHHSRQRRVETHRRLGSPAGSSPARHSPPAEDLSSPRSLWRAMRGTAFISSSRTCGFQTGNTRSWFGQGAFGDQGEDRIVQFGRIGEGSAKTAA